MTNNHLMDIIMMHLCHYVIFNNKNNDKGTLFFSKCGMGRNNLEDSYGIAQKSRHIKMKRTSKTSMMQKTPLIILESAVSH